MEKGRASDTSPAAYPTWDIRSTNKHCEERSTLPKPLAHRGRRRYNRESSHYPHTLTTIISCDGECYSMGRVLTYLLWLKGCCLDVLHFRFVRWTKPATHSFLIGSLTDLGRSKSQLIAENALLRHQLIILRRQVKRPACTKKDRVLLVLLARWVRTWQQTLFIVQPETRLARAAGALPPRLEA
jgi:hypothetical protein